MRLLCQINRSAVLTVGLVVLDTLCYILPPTVTYVYVEDAAVVRKRYSKPIATYVIHL